MPSYQYQCGKCGNRFDVTRPMSARGAVACPKCQSKDTRQVLTPFYAKTIKKS
jgi:putative FmdB family regulatory protein